MSTWSLGEEWEQGTSSPAGQVPAGGRWTAAYQPQAVILYKYSASLTEPHKVESDPCSMAQLGYAFSPKVAVLIPFNTATTMTKKKK